MAKPIQLTHRHQYARRGRGYGRWPEHRVSLAHWEPRPETPTSDGHLMFLIRQSIKQAQIRKQETV